MGGQEVSGATEKKTWKEEKEHLQVGCPHLTQVTDWAPGILRSD